MSKKKEKKNKKQLWHCRIDHLELDPLLDSLDNVHFVVLARDEESASDIVVDSIMEVYDEECVAGLSRSDLLEQIEVESCGDTRAVRLSVSVTPAIDVDFLD